MTATASCAQIRRAEPDLPISLSRQSRRTPAVLDQDGDVVRLPDRGLNDMLQAVAPTVSGGAFDHVNHPMGEVVVMDGFDVRVTHRGEVSSSI